MTRLGNAPVSFGVFGTTGGSAAPADMLTALAAAGYDGSELGPPGLFGTPSAAAALFHSLGLQSVGAYVPLHLALDDDSFEADLERMAVTCRELTATGAQLAILADEGSPELLLHPAREGTALALDTAAWQLATHRLARAVALAREHGLAASFHPHISTYVESAWEVDRLIDTTDVTLTLDIGHMALAGADPVDCVHRWRDRIDHIHVKDVDRGVLQAAKSDGRALAEEIADGITAAQSQGLDYLLGCPGGRSPRSTYAAFAHVVAERSLDLSNVIIVMMDDYVVEVDGQPQRIDPREHCSVEGFALTEILAPLNDAAGPGRGITPDRLWIPDPADPRAYDARITSAGGIDLFILASGDSDGHIAFNAPGAPRDSRTRIVELPESTRRDNLGTFPHCHHLDQSWSHPARQCAKRCPASAPPKTTNPTGPQQT